MLTCSAFGGPSSHHNSKGRTAEGGTRQTIRTNVTFSLFFSLDEKQRKDYIQWKNMMLSSISKMVFDCKLSFLFFHQERKREKGRIELCLGVKTESGYTETFLDWPRPIGHFRTFRFFFWDGWDDFVFFFVISLLLFPLFLVVSVWNKNK